MSEPVLVPPGGGEVVGDAPDRRVEILADGEALVATWSRFGPHREGADLHVHYLHTDLFYVLEGELSVRLGPEDRAVPLPAGTLARVPPLVVHGFRNAAGAEARYLNFHAPGQRFADFMRALAEGRSFAWDQHPPPAEGGRPVAEAAIGGAYVLADRPGLRVALLADVEELGISETWSEPGGAAPPLHVHHRHVESCYVLEGELAFAAGGRELRAGAGAWVQVPPGVPHTLAVAGDAPARFLELHTPSCGYGVFLRGLHRGDEELVAFDQAPA